MSSDDQLHQAGVQGPRSPVVPALLGAIVGAAVTFGVLQLSQPPPPPPAPAPVAVAEPVPCVPPAAPEAPATPPPAPVKTAARPRANGNNQIANLLGSIDPVPAAPRRSAVEVDRDALARFIRERLSTIRVCYDRELKLNPSLKGKVVVRFNVTPAGRVGNGAIESDTMRDEKVSRCILAIMKGWSLPFHPSEDTAVSFPFVFQPGG